MNPDETQGVSPETDTDLLVPEEGTPDPIDAVEDIDALRRIAKANRSMAARYKGKVKTPQKPQQNIIQPEVSKPQGYNILEDDIADLLLDGYNRDEVKFLVANGGRKALEDKNSFAYVAIQTKRDQRKAEQAASQTGSTGSGYVDAENKVTIDQLKNMSVADMAKVLPHAGDR